MAHTATDEDWCDDCEMYVWNCGCGDDDRYDVSHELEEIEFLDNLEDSEYGEEFAGE